MLHYTTYLFTLDNLHQGLQLTGIYNVTSSTMVQLGLKERVVTRNSDTFNTQHTTIHISSLLYTILYLCHSGDYVIVQCIFVDFSCPCMYSAQQHGNTYIHNP